MTEPTATDEVADFNPERCTYTSDLDGAARVRCTARADEEHAHRWRTEEQQRWVDETLTTLEATMRDADERWASGLKPGTEYRVWVGGEGPTTLRTTDADA